MRYLRGIMVVTVMALCGLVVAHTATAGAGWSRTKGFARTYSKRVYGTRRRTSLQRPNPYDYHGWYYPRYFGGFHARYFEEFGYPAHDRTLRAEPW